MYASVKHFLPVTTVQRERLLPVPGKVLARRGQKVNPSDVVAEAVVAPEHVLLDVARGLGVSAENADQYIQRQAGDQVQEGDVIAGPYGLGRRVMRSPQAGTVVVSGSGQVLLELASRPFELRAGLAGTVTELYPDRGVLIEASGALIQGVWGNDRLDAGPLTVLARSADEELTVDRLDVSMRGAVILAGYVANPEVIAAADDIPLRGLILSSMSALLVPRALKALTPIMLIEGFGRIPMNFAAFKLLSTSERREVSVMAFLPNRFTGNHPEALISISSVGGQPPAADIVRFEKGQQVRVVSPPYLGKLGEIQAILPGLVVLESGIRTAAAQVVLETSETVVLPLANLEILD